VTADRIERCARLLLAAARESGMTVSGDGRVSEVDAARLLALSAGHLKNLRAARDGPIAYARGLAGCRVTYRLEDLAVWVESGRDGI
jgi:hypothetical protein